jgi:glutathione S-transferase
LFLKQETERNRSVLEEKRRALCNLLRYLEDALGDKPYFLGEFSLTDIDLWPRFGRMEEYGVLPTPSLPRLNGWLERMKQRPSVQLL